MSLKYPTYYLDLNEDERIKVLNMGIKCHMMIDELKEPLVDRVVGMVVDSFAITQKCERDPRPPLIKETLLSNHQEESHTPHVAQLPSIRGRQGEIDVMSMVKYPILDTSKKPHSTDFVVAQSKGRIYVEVKTYTGIVPKKELDKFYKDIDTKGDIYAALLVGWNENKFLYHVGLPIMFIKSHDLVNEALDILYSVEKRTKEAKLLESLDGMVDMLNTIDLMTTSFMKYRDDLRSRILTFRERARICCEDEKSHNDILESIDPSCHAFKTDIYTFIKSILPKKAMVKDKTIKFNDVTIKLLKTKTKITLSLKDSSFMPDSAVKDSQVTLDITPETMQFIRDNL